MLLVYVSPAACSDLAHMSRCCDMIRSLRMFPMLPIGWPDAERFELLRRADCAILAESDARDRAEAARYEIPVSTGGDERFFADAKERAARCGALRMFEPRLRRQARAKFSFSTDSASFDFTP